MASTAVTPVVPSQRVRRLAEASGKSLSKLAEGDLQIQVPGLGEPVILPAEAVRLLVEMLGELAHGHGVGVVSYEAELTTQQAADLLGVSKPWIVKEMDSGALPHSLVGSQRRVRLEDLLRYKAELKLKRLETLEELSAISQELDLGY